MDEVRSCDHSCGLGRREFLGAATLTALALLQAACGSAGDLGLGPSVSGGPLLVTLSQYPALANVGGVARVDGGNGSPVALVRTGSATFTALSLVCPHQGSTVGLNGTSGFLCPNHGARFANSGQWQGGQPTGNLQSIAATYNATAGTVTVNR